jgi:adenylate cyclase
VTAVGPDEPSELAPRERPDSRMARIAEALRRWDQRAGVVRTAQSLRGILPGDERYGDPLSVTGKEPSQVMAQRLAAITAQRPSAMREVGLSALQVWQALSEAQGRGRGDEEVAILFTDLVEFSSWALEAGDTLALNLLRDVGQAVEPAIDAHGGRIVKRLGDGLMAVFHHPQPAVEAALEGAHAVRRIEVAGHEPGLRAGVHFGKPRRIGDDYLGVDVNIAARVAEAAGAGEVLVSEAARERLDDEELSLKRKWRFKAKGAPDDLKVYSAHDGS